MFDSVIDRARGRSSVLKRGKCNDIGNLIKEVLVLCCVTARTVRCGCRESSVAVYERCVSECFRESKGE